MTGDNIKQNVAEELKRAGDALRAARALADLGLAAASASRAFLSDRLSRSLI